MDLAELYALLPAAEEEDLLEQLRQEREQQATEELAAAWRAWPASRPLAWDLWSGAPTDDDDPPPPEDPPEDDRPLALPVLLALLEHQLGATRLDRPTES